MKKELLNLLEPHKKETCEINKTNFVQQQHKYEAHQNINIYFNFRFGFVFGVKKLSDFIFGCFFTHFTIPLKEFLKIFLFSFSLTLGVFILMFGCNLIRSTRVFNDFFSYLLYCILILCSFLVLFSSSCLRTMLRKRVLYKKRQNSWIFD